MSTVTDHQHPDAPPLVAEHRRPPIDRDDLPVRWQGSADRAQGPPTRETLPPLERPALAPTALLRLERLRLRTVAKVASLVSLGLLIVATGAAVVLWMVARSTGAVAEMESLMAGITGNQSFVIDGGTVLTAFLVAGAVVAVLAVLATVAVATLLNGASALKGGIEAELRRVPVAGRA